MLVRRASLPLLALVLGGCKSCLEPSAPVIATFCPEPQPALADLGKYVLIDVAVLEAATETVVADKYASWAPFQLTGCESEGVDVLDVGAYASYIDKLGEADVNTGTMLVPAKGAWAIESHAVALDPKTVHAMQQWQDAVGLTALAGSVTGVGSSVIVLDTGLPAAHPLLDPVEWHHACFAAKGCGPAKTDSCRTLAGTASDCAKCDTEQECIHGAAMSGVIAGVVPSTAPAGTVGTIPFAPRAQKFAVRTMKIGAHTSPDVVESDLIAALKWVLAEAKGGATFGPVAIMYLGFASSMDYAGKVCPGSGGPPHPVATLLKRIRARGVRVVAPAGNGGAADGVAAPACFDDVISVSASDSTDPQKPAHWSNGQATADLMAPGEFYAGSANLLLPDSTTPTEYVWSFGTSVAAAQVVGALALLGERMDPAEWATTSDATLLNCVAGGPVTKTPTKIQSCAQPTSYTGRPRLDVSGLLP